MSEEKKRQRKPRRNFEKTLAELGMYVDISIGVIEAISATAEAGTERAFDGFNRGQLAALRAVKARLQGGAA